MLNRARFTSEKSTRRALASVRAKSVRRAASAALGVFLALGSEINEIKFVAANAPEKSRSFATQRQESRRGAPQRRSSQPERLQRLSSATSSSLKSDELERELAQIEFQFQEARKIGSERLDRLTAQIDVLLATARRLAERPAANSELAKRAETLVAQLQSFQRFINDSSDFFQRLAKLDAASLDVEETRSFFALFLAESAPTGALTSPFGDVSNATVPDGALASDASTPTTSRLSTLIERNYVASPSRSTRFKRLKFGTLSSKRTAPNSNVFTSTRQPPKTRLILSRKSINGKDFPKNFKRSDDAPSNGGSRR